VRVFAPETGGFLPGFHGRFPRLSDRAKAGIAPASKAVMFEPVVRGSRTRTATAAAFL
jgi:hypothetical protein